MTDLDRDVTELLILLPHLSDALERDGGTSAGPVVSGGSDPAFRLPVNADVLAAAHLLGLKIPTLAAWAAGVVAERPQARSIESHVRHVRRWHERMLVTAAAEDAEHLATEIRETLRHVKIALGLIQPDHYLGQYCPLHDEPLTELISRGNVAMLLYRQHPDPGRRVTPIVEWVRHDAATCRTCHATWAPVEYLTLSRLLRQADNRRVRASQAAAS